MSQSLNPPTSSIVADYVGIDAVINRINAELSSLPWLMNVLGRVYPQQNESGRSEPWIYKGDNEYYRAFPNDTLTSFSCLYPHDDDDILNKGFFGERTLSAIVWLNFRALNAMSPSVETFKQDVIRLLRPENLDCVSSINSAFEQASDGAQGIYPGFDLSNLETRYNTFPYRAFRIELTVNYPIVC